MHINPYILPGIPADPDSVIRFCESAYGLDPGATLNPTRLKKVVHPRQLAMFFIREWLGYSLKNTGYIFKKDHATVIHACNCVKNYIVYDKVLKEKFMEVSKNLLVQPSFINKVLA